MNQNCPEFVNLTQARVTWEGGPSAEEQPPPDCPVGLSLGGIFLINDQCRRSQPTLRSAFPGLIVLDVIRKQAEQASGSKSVGSTPAP